MEQASAAEFESRLPVIDIMRGCAIVLMIFQHTPIYLLSNASGALLGKIAFYASRVSLPLFLFLAGFSTCLSARKRIPKVGERGYLKHLFLRVCGLFVFASIVNFFRMNSYSVINVLHIIGLSVLMCGLIFVSSNASACKIVIAIMFLYSFVGPLQPPDKLVSLPDYFLSIFTKGEYPPGMWFIYSFIGLYVCWFSLDKLHSRRALMVASVFLLLSVQLVLAGMDTASYENRAPFLFFMLFCIIVTYYLIWRLSADKKIAAFKVLATYGRHSLLIYMSHQFLFITLPTLSGFSNKFNNVQTLSVFILFLSISFFLIRVFERSRNEFYVYS
jgi:uncharacterized membrane protein